VDGDRLLQRTKELAQQGTTRIDLGLFHLLAVVICFSFSVGFVLQPIAMMLLLVPGEAHEPLQPNFLEAADG
jgi:hypothetical protein